MMADAQTTMEDPFPLDNRQPTQATAGRRAPLLFPYSSCTRQASRSIYSTESSISSPSAGTYCWTIRVRPATLAGLSAF